MAACASSEAWQWAMHLVEGEPWRGRSSTTKGVLTVNKQGTTKYSAWTGLSSKAVGTAGGALRWFVLIPLSCSFDPFDIVMSHRFHRSNSKGFDI